MAEALKRRIGLGLLTFYGVGVMVGAGIYVLVGAVAGLAGSLAWLAFLIAGIVALPSALSFAELSSRVPEAGGEVAYLRAAFGSETLARLVGFAIVIAGTVSAAAVLRGGVGYLTSIVDVPSALAMVTLALLLVALAIVGVVESLVFAAVLTAVEVVGLMLVIGAGMTAEPLVQTAPGDIGVGLNFVLAGAALAFFAFIGFEDMVNLAEETRDPTRTMPRAILIALVIVTALYALVAFAATRVVPAPLLAGSDRPLALVWEAGTGGSATPTIASATSNSASVTIASAEGTSTMEVR